jgi:hypothetical protein
MEGDSIRQLLSLTPARRESLTDLGIGYIRKKDNEGRVVYLINNLTNDSFDDWITLHVTVKNIDVFDPMTGLTGQARVDHRKTDGTRVYVQLQTHQSLILRTNSKNEDSAEFPYYSPAGESMLLPGPWKIKFHAGGPALPPSLETDSLVSWTTFGEAYQTFSGSADYVNTFKKPGQLATHWKLNLGIVNESARVYLNGVFLGTLIGPDYSLVFESSLLKEKNELKVIVSNLMANRIADMDRKGIFWKKFYNVNFPARRAENRTRGLFDASSWIPKPSGLIGAVQIMPLKIQQK